jgi:hypothetical protein
MAPKPSRVTWIVSPSWICPLSAAGRPVPIPVEVVLLTYLAPEKCRWSEGTKRCRRDA